ncbi:DUF4381 domain-containing protein [Rhizobium tumorigenes]|uniref:DUF4381 domain-containing protein n=1 Tax=Rhizobium tumorigenes TaxID=2041385 RepID=A0AAF1KF48_9HYPH|nr:DUF4381 domain-containing protein [Rhizobium tumorigenes]WFR97577.1 DUF4381 domain-containing protein [Rhizobium tumorigenes]WFS03179.1 DUF4381 domain-containing protein [Rhizobium tumorigenes]
MEPQAPRLDPMTEAALKTLKDISTPEPVSWVPQTWGWGVLAGLLALLVISIAVRWFLRYRANAYRREALALLFDIEEKMSDPARRHDGVHDLTELLKRVALAAWPRQEVASMHGLSWTRFLGNSDDKVSETSLSKLLDDFEYRDIETLDTMPSNVGDDLILSARKWIEGHHVSA